MMNNNFNISVIIPVYKAENFIRKAVESVLFHSEVKEIILVEDGSPDNSLQECQKLVNEYDCVSLYRHPNGINKGAGASRNLGIEKASQEYISFLDADDLMTKVRFHKEKEIFSDNPDADGVYGAIGVIYYDDFGAKSWERWGYEKSTLITVNKVIPPQDLFEHVTGFRNDKNYKGFFSIDSLTLKRSKVLKHKISFDEDLRLGQDTVFKWQCAYYLKLYTGDYLQAVAIAGIHKDNRYVNNKNINKSKSKQYKSLYTWSLNFGLNIRHQKYFNAQYMFYNCKQISNYKNLLKSIYLAFTNNYFRRIIATKFLDILYTIFLKK